MRHRILNITAIIAIMAFSASVCQAQFQLVNPSFESWESTAANAKPTGWSSFPQSDGSFASLASTPQHYQRNGGRPGHSGSKDHTLYALVDGVVSFRKKVGDKSFVSVTPEA